MKTSVVSAFHGRKKNPCLVVSTELVSRHLTEHSPFHSAVPWLAAAIGLVTIVGCGSHEKVLREYPGEVIEVVPISKRTELRGASHVSVVTPPTWNTQQLTVSVKRHEYSVVEELERRKCVQEIRKVTVKDTADPKYEARRALFFWLIGPIIAIDKAITYNKALKLAMETGQDSYAGSTETVDGGHRATVTTITKFMDKTIDCPLPERATIIGLKPWSACQVVVTIRTEQNKSKSAKTGNNGQAVIEIGDLVRASRTGPVVLLVSAGTGVDKKTVFLTVDGSVTEAIRLVTCREVSSILATNGFVESLARVNGYAASVFEDCCKQLMDVSMALDSLPRATSLLDGQVHSRLDAVLEDLVKCVSVTNELTKCRKDRDRCEKRMRALERTIRWLKVNLKVENDPAQQKSLKDAHASRDRLRVELGTHRALLKSSGIDEKLVDETQTQCQEKHRSLKAMHDKYLAGISAVMDAAFASPADRPRTIKKAKAFLDEAVRYAGSCSLFATPALEKKIFHHLRSQHKREQR